MQTLQYSAQPHRWLKFEKTARNVDEQTTSREYADVTVDQCWKRLAAKGIEQSIRHATVMMSQRC